MKPVDLHVRGKLPKHTFAVGDRVTCPEVDDIPGTVVEIGYNGFTKVKYDDGQVGCTEACHLARIDPDKPCYAR
jgi:hypothetical protein